MLPVLRGFQTVHGFPDLLDRHQRTPYGTWAWHTDYNGRNQAENVNAMLKGNGGIDKRSCRPHGTVAHTIAALALTVAHNPTGAQIANIPWWPRRDSNPRFRLERPAS